MSEIDFELSFSQIAAVAKAMSRHYPDGCIPEDHLVAALNQVTRGLIGGAIANGILQGRITCRWVPEIEDLRLTSSDTLVVPE